MPRAWLNLLIVGFWLLTTGHLFVREILPAIRVGEPPPYVIDLVAEATGEEPTVTWQVYSVDDKSSTRIGRVRTSMKYDEKSDTFRFFSEINELELSPAPLVSAKVQQLGTTLIVNHAGELRGFTANGSLSFGAILGSPLKIEIAADGMVANGMVTPTIRLDGSFGKFQRTGDPTPIVAGSVLTPLQPVNRIQGLRIGQRWRMPMLDPLGEAFRSALAKQPELAPFIGQTSGPRYLDAVVEPSPTPLAYQGRPVATLVIIYTGPDTTARTFVRASDGFVLRQEALSPTGLLLRLQRE